MLLLSYELLLKNEHFFLNPLFSQTFGLISCVGFHFFFHTKIIHIMITLLAAVKLNGEIQRKPSSLFGLLNPSSTVMRHIRCEFRQRRTSLPLVAQYTSVSTTYCTYTTCKGFLHVSSLWCNNGNKRICHHFFSFFLSQDHIFRCPFSSTLMMPMCIWHFNSSVYTLHSYEFI